MKALLSRRFDELQLLVIYIDGLIFGDYTMIGAVSEDTEGTKHVLGTRKGATENSTEITELLEVIVAQGVDAKRQMLFVIDGRRRSEQPSTPFSALISRCNAAVPISCATYSTICPKSSGHRPRA